MRLTALAIIFAAVTLLSGCVRARITTDIHSDGTWTRTLVFTDMNGDKAEKADPSIEGTFVVPAGAQWKFSELKKGQERTFTYERKFAAGAPSKGDLSIRDEAKTLRLNNEVSVKRAGAGRFEYRETLHWIGGAPEMTIVQPEELAAIKGSLPGSLATDENARALAQKTAALMVPVLFGPGEPLLDIGIVHPDLAERQARRRLGAVVMKALEEEFGDKMQFAQRQEVARKLIGTTFSGGSSKKDSGPTTPLMFIVKMPGHVVSSNGEVDELSGEVYWALFPQAASLKDLVLTAIVESAPAR